jgi:hypothetical protein
MMIDHRAEGVPQIANEFCSPLFKRSHENVYA